MTYGVVIFDVLFIILLVSQQPLLLLLLYYNHCTSVLLRTILYKTQHSSADKMRNIVIVLVCYRRTKVLFSDNRSYVGKEQWFHSYFVLVGVRTRFNTSSHLYQPYGHVITGDLSIIPNSKLRDLIAKGPKYREPCKVDWDKNLSLLCEAVDQYALQWTKREMVELSVLSSWKEMVKGQIEEHISKLKRNFKQPTGKVLQNADVKACLSDLHNKCLCTGR